MSGAQRHGHDLLAQLKGPRCEFEQVASGRLRCRRCGFETTSPFPPQRVWRRCDVWWEEEAPQGPSLWGLSADRGLGDTVARFLQWIGIRKRPGCGCEHRQEWLNRLVPYPWAGPEPPLPLARTRRARVLIRFPHGLGDCVQWTVVLQHLKHLRPQWEVHLAVRPGAESLFQGLAAGVWPLGISACAPRLAPCASKNKRQRAQKRLSQKQTLPYAPQAAGRKAHAAPWDLFRFLQWPECPQCFADSPATKAEWCLRNVFRIQPQLQWCRYKIEISQEKSQQARAWLEQTSRGRPVALIHFRGASSRRKKNVPAFVIRRLVQELAQGGVVPVVLDWLPDCPARAWPEAVLAGPECPLWSGQSWADGQMLAALASQAQLCVGIDSGPGHIFGATSTPTLILWTRHHPLHFYGLSPNVVHLVPVHHEKLLRSPGREAGLRFFEKHYQYRIYQHLEEAVVEVAWERLGNGGLGGLKEEKPVGMQKRHRTNPPSPPRPPRPSGLSRLHASRPSKPSTPYLFDGNCWVRRRWHQWDMVVVRDVLLGDCYQVDRLPGQVRYVVDVGAHIGAFARRVTWRLHPQGVVVCVEANPKNLPILQWNLKRLAHFRPGRFEALWAACTYESGPLGLLDTVFDQGRTTGGSVVVRQDEERFAQPGPHYRPWKIEIPRITLEEIQKRFDMPRIDLLKLDCEGSEFSILENCNLDRIVHIVGEYHDRQRFEKLRLGRLKDWDVKILKDGPLGLFWATNSACALRRTA